MTVGWGAGIWRSSCIRLLRVSGNRPGPGSSLGLLCDPQEPSENWSRGGKGRRLARDPGQPIWVLLTWPRGPDDHPPPSSVEKGGAGGYAPSPNTVSVSGGGDTPDYILPPHQAEGNIGSPLEDSTVQILHCSGLTAENHHPPGVLRPHPGGPKLATPTQAPPVLPVWPMEEQRPARAWESPVAPGLDSWEDFVGGGVGERVLHPCQPPPFPGVAEPQRSQLARRYGGLPLPSGSMRHSFAW